MSSMSSHPPPNPSLKGLNFVSVSDGQEEGWTPAYMRDPSHVTALDIQSVPSARETISLMGQDIGNMSKSLGNKIFGQCTNVSGVVNDEEGLEITEGEWPHEVEDKGDFRFEYGEFSNIMVLAKMILITRGSTWQSEERLTKIFRENCCTPARSCLLYW